jgi:hypothetical protein
MTRLSRLQSAEARANQRAYFESREIEGLSPPRLAIVVAVVTYRQVNPAKWGVHPRDIAAMLGRKSTAGGWLQNFTWLIDQGWIQRRVIAVNASCAKAPVSVYAPTPKAFALCYAGGAAQAAE